MLPYYDCPSVLQTKSPLVGCRTLVVGVGGVNIAELFGVLCYLEKYSLLPTFNRLIGSSSSSFVCLALLLCQAKRKSFREYVYSLFALVRDRPFFDQFNSPVLWYWKGICAKGIRTRIIEHLYDYFQLDRSTTFKQLYYDTDVLYVTNGLCLTEKENYYFSRFTTPDIVIYDCLLTVTSVLPFSPSSSLIFPDGKEKRIYDPGCGPRFCPGCFLPSSSLYSLMNDRYFVGKEFGYKPSKQEEILAIVLLPSLAEDVGKFPFVKKLIHYTTEKCWYDQRNLFPNIKTILIPHERFPYPSATILEKSFLLGQSCVRDLLISLS